MVRGAGVFSTYRFRKVVFPGPRRRSRPVNLAPVSLALCEPPEESPLSDRAGQFLNWLLPKAGLDPKAYRGETLRRRLPACLRFLRATTPSQAQRILEQNPGLVTGAVHVMLVGVTSFFRDPDVFQWLADEVLAVREGSHPRLYAWSAGCSEGSELYSLAILLAERGRLSQSYLLGTDCRGEAIEHARRAVYDEAGVRGVPDVFLQRYFARQEDGWALSQRIRTEVRWSVSDLLKGIEPGAWDIILFRNTSMYLRSEALAELWPKIESSLRPGGILVLGRAERPMGAKRLSPVRPCIFKRLRA